MSASRGQAAKHRDGYGQGMVTGTVTDRRMTLGLVAGTVGLIRTPIRSSRLGTEGQVLFTWIYRVPRYLDTLRLEYDTLRLEYIGSQSTSSNRLLDPAVAALSCCGNAPPYSRWLPKSIPLLRPYLQRLGAEKIPTTIVILFLKLWHYTKQKTT